MNITSSWAIVFYVQSLFTAYVLVIFFPALPFLAFASQLTIAFVAYITKRVFQKKKEYNGRP